MSLKGYIPSPGEHGEGEVAEALESFTKKGKKRKKKKTHKKWRLIKHVREDVCLSVGIFARSLSWF